MKKKKIFFAYESNHQENRDAILKGINSFNTHQTSYAASSWESLKVGGRIIDQTVLQAIENCDIFACDLTYLNHNVLFELGYAIARSKNLQIFLNPTVKNSKKNYADIKILKNIGYVEFNNLNGITKGLQQKTNIDAILIDQIINIEPAIENNIFLINNSLNNQASLDLEDGIKNSRYKTVISNPSEVEYQTLSWFIRNILASSISIIHLVSYEKVDYSKQNSELSFYAGVALGLNRKVIMLAPAPFNAPIDYTDILIEYTDSDDCVLKTMETVEAIIPQCHLSSSVSSTNQKLDIVEDKDINLIKLGIGFETAEDEENQLPNYYIEIDAYRQAIERKSYVILGRKGSGKTALFYKMKNELDTSSDTYNVILKPDSEELLDNVDFSKLFSTERAKKSFLFTVWRFVLFSKLYISIANKLINKTGVQYNEQEQDIVEYYMTNEKLLALNFYGILLSIYKKSKDNNLFENPTLLEEFYSEVYKPLHDRLIEYFKGKKYVKIMILADNLDKSWEAKNDLILQSEMILSLLEFAGKIPIELNNENIKISSIIFLRKDIFDYILSVAREPDKLTTKTFEIDWNNQEEKLKELIEKRFKYSLSLSDSFNMIEVWNEYFKFNVKKHPFEKIIKTVVSRPRDIIYFVSKLFESAVNKNKKIVNDEDFDYAVDAYSNFLHKNMIAELKAEYPEIENILNEIQSKYYGLFFDYNNLLELLEFVGYDSAKGDDFINTLFNNDYIIGEVNGRIIRSHEELKELNKEKKFFFFKKHSVKILLHPDWYTVRKQSKFALSNN